MKTTPASAPNQLRIKRAWATMGEVHFIRFCCNSGRYLNTYSTAAGHAVDKCN